jgi:ArsR family transcriptional regulator
VDVLKQQNVSDLADLRPLFKRHADLCQALANEHRLAILHALGADEVCVGDLARALDIPVSTASQHLRILKERMAVRSRKEGQTVYYSVTNPHLLEACALIRRALVEELQATGDVLDAAHLLDPADRRRRRTTPAT